MTQQSNDAPDKQEETQKANQADVSKSVEETNPTPESTNELSAAKPEEAEAQTPDLQLANDDGTDEIETDKLVPPIDSSHDDMVHTKTLDELGEETHVAISGTVDENPELLGKAYEMAEAAADHESVQPVTDETDADSSEASEEAAVAISGVPHENPELLTKAYDLAENAADRNKPESETESTTDSGPSADIPKGAQSTADEQDNEGVASPEAAPADASVPTDESSENDEEDDDDDDNATTDDSDEDDEDDSDDSEELDYATATKEELAAALEKELAVISATGVGMKQIKRIDGVVKEVRPVLTQMKRTEWDAAKEKYVADTGSEDGFEYTHDAQTSQVENLLKEIRAKRKAFFQDLDKNRDQNFNQKTELLQRLRELVDTDDSQEVGAADIKNSWEEFKKIQEEWKQAGNVSSAHNGTLWATYNALVDRYFSNRNIYFELKELDRKKNSDLKVELCEKIEALVKTLEERPMSREILKEGNEIFEEYKHVGPAPREEQELLWGRFKESLDALYDARRAQYEEQKKSMVEIYEKKSKIYETIIPYTTFSSGSINEWNAKTREIIAYQEEWQSIKGPMPRGEGKDLSKKFWGSLKTFFNNKSEFFKQLEAKREVNLKAKQDLCAQVDQILESGEDNAANTQRIIELQKQWKSIGQVPEKFKNSIYKRFKEACDAYFNNKRSKHKEQDKEFEENLAQKEALCDRIEKAAADPGDSTLANLNDFKAEWAKIGFVPRKAMQKIQKRYIDAVNSYVGSLGKLSSKQKEQVILESEVAMVREGDSSRNLNRKESDIRRKVTQLENDIALWENNIEFFAKSKSADKVKAQFEEKIKKASEELEALKHQLTVIQEAI
ncbi:DUF349 domain-containing protein [Persicitalea jodogahamensis]|uniref:DUF349 domain-containing protein n=1 Tax=Persicitalea jodogahamensis TaxID=402147 RepID=A0A8J3GB54_9BACT|nr:DUF349 domain-containing protein [Persicitalea jodogahamensis]GHB79311.1 hypothetical protein GCM10007390_36630 [Persicitalea jodogahamensis]